MNVDTIVLTGFIIVSNLFLAPAAAEETELLYYTWHTSCKANCKSFLPDFFLSTVVLFHGKKKILKLKLSMNTKV